MRIALLITAAATALCSLGVAASAQEAPAQLGASTGQDLSQLALQLVEATRSEIAFGIVPDTRYRVVQHLETGFTCAFLPGTEAAVAVVAVDDLSKVGDDTVCIERIDGTENSYRITQLPGQTIEQVFEAATANVGGWLTGDLKEIAAAPNLLASPNQPDVMLDMPRMQVTLIGDTEAGPAMLRIAVARRPGDWYITQSYFAPLADAATEEERVALAGLGSALAESVFAIRLGELLHPTVDPGLVALGTLNR